MGKLQVGDRVVITASDKSLVQNLGIAKHHYIVKHRRKGVIGTIVDNKHYPYLVTNLAKNVNIGLFSAKEIKRDEQ